MDKLTPQLNRQQLQENIDSLIKQKAPQNVIQDYINKYQQDSTGKFTLKGYAAPVETPKKDLGDYSAEAITEGVKKIGSSIQGASQKYQEGVAQGGAGGILKSTGGLLEGALGTASGFLQTIFSPLTAVTNQAGDKLGELASNPKTLMYHIANSGFGDAIAKGEQGVNDWATAHPELATNLSDAVNVGLAGVLGGKSKIRLPDTATLKGDFANLKTGLKDVGVSVKENVVVLKDTIKSKASSITKGKTEAQILATPKEQVYKLNPTERKLYFENEATKISTQSEATTAKIKAEHETKTQQLADNFRNNKSQSFDDFKNQQNKLDTEYQNKKDKIIESKTKQHQNIEQEFTDTQTKIKSDLKIQADKTSARIEALQKELATASRDKVIELRPKIVKAMGEQSKIYRKLIAEEMAGKENTPVKIDDLKTHIDTVYGDNPSLATAVKEKLGLTETTPILKKGEVPTIQAEAPTKTLGELYEQTKVLKQDISTGATKGSKVFTPADKLTDDAIHTLTDFMKKNGVDFKEANQFWSKYAPIRDQLASEAKPFLQTGTKTKTFAGTLKRVAEGKDINNENFIKEVENLVGEKITKEAKTIVSKLDKTQKVEIANKIDAENKLLDAQLAKEKTQTESKQISNSELKKLEDNFNKSKEKLDKVKVENQNKSTNEKIQEKRKLTIAKEKALETLENAKSQSLTKLNSEQFEIERQARFSSRVKKVFISGVLLYGAKKLGITHFFGVGL